MSRYNPAADIPMSYGVVILAITLGFSGLGKITAIMIDIGIWREVLAEMFAISAAMTNPFFHENNGETYHKKWQKS